MTLSSFSFQDLDSNRLSFQTSLEAIINKPFVDFSKSSFTEVIILWEALCDRFELLVGEDVNVYEKRVWEVVEWDGWIAEIRQVDSASNRALFGEHKKSFLWWVFCSLLVCVVDATYWKTYILPRKSHWFHLKESLSLCVSFRRFCLSILLMVFFFWIYIRDDETSLKRSSERERERWDIGEDSKKQVYSLRKPSKVKEAWHEPVSIIKYE